MTQRQKELRRRRNRKAKNHKGQTKIRIPNKIKTTWG